MEDISRIFPGWQIVRKIGRGSFGTVYEISHEMNSIVEKAALKVISVPDDPDEIKKYINEGYSETEIREKIKSDLDNVISEYEFMSEFKGCSNIVCCEDIEAVEKEDGFGWDIYIKMELLESLGASVGIIPDDKTVINIAVDMCSALELCEKNGIIHRDIKPQNILVSDSGCCKLGDFGVAISTDSTVFASKIGTYNYMAPEVFFSKAYNTSADIYSLGIVLYWLLNERKQPFCSANEGIVSGSLEESARQRRLKGEELPLPKHGSRVLQEIVLKACEVDVSCRYASATEMLKDLKNLERYGEKSFYDDKGNLNIRVKKSKAVTEAELKTDSADPEATYGFRNTEGEVIDTAVKAENNKFKFAVAVVICILIIAGVYVISSVNRSRPSVSTSADTTTTAAVVEQTSESEAESTTAETEALTSDYVTQEHTEEKTEYQTEEYTDNAVAGINVNITAGTWNSEALLAENTPVCFLSIKEVNDNNVKFDFGFTRLYSCSGITVSLDSNAQGSFLAEFPKYNNAEIGRGLVECSFTYYGDRIHISVLSSDCDIEAGSEYDFYYNNTSVQYDDPATESISQGTADQLTKEDIRALYIEATDIYEHYWYKPETSETDSLTNVDTILSRTFYAVTESTNTKEKLFDALDDYFTDNVIEKLYSECYYEENGKLYYAVYPGGFATPFNVVRDDIIINGNNWTYQVYYVTTDSNSDKENVAEFEGVIDNGKNKFTEFGMGSGMFASGVAAL